MTVSWSRAQGLGLRANVSRTARPQPSALSPFVAVVLAALLCAGVYARAADPLPELVQPVNDFAKVVDADSASAMDRLIRTLQTATGDIVVVATVPTIEPYGDIKEYAVKLFANNGKGIVRRARTTGC